MTVNEIIKTECTLGCTGAFGKSVKGYPHFWKVVHEDENSAVIMLDDLWAERMDFHEAQKTILGDFLILSDEERNLIPNEDEPIWIPSVKQLGFVPVGHGEARGLNEILKDCVPEKVWEEETFQYFSDPETAAKRRKEFGKQYWTSTPYMRYSYSVWNVGSFGAAYRGFGTYDLRELRPCIKLDKTKWLNRGI